MKLMELFKRGPALTVVEGATIPSLGTDWDMRGRPWDLKRAAEICRELAERNPLARRLIRLDIDYTVGSQVSFQVVLPEGQEDAQERVQLELERWVDRGRVNTLFWQDLMRRLLTDGEIAVKMVPGPSGLDRPVIMTTTDMETVADGDSGDVVALIGYVDGVKTRYTVVNSLTADTEAGGRPVLYFRHDVSGADDTRMRGIPELLPLITRLQYEDEVTKLEVQRAKSMLRYFWQVIVKGASGAELERMQREYAQAPATGTVRYTNENVEFKGVAPDLASYETSRVLQDVRISIAGGAGVPVHFLGEGGDANLATATAMNTPAHRHFERLQGEFSEMMETVLRAGLQIIGVSDPEISFDLTLPEMDAEDQVAATQTLVQATAAVQSLVDGRFITHPAGQRVLATVLEQTIGVALVDDDMPAEPEEEDVYKSSPPPVPPADDEAEGTPPEEE